jgi:hypothetical protein
LGLPRILGQHPPILPPPQAGQYEREVSTLQRRQERAANGRDSPDYRDSTDLLVGQA